MSVRRAVGLLLIAFAVQSTAAGALTIASVCKPVDQSEFVSRLGAFGMRQVSTTELGTDAGYPVDLASAASLCVELPSSEQLFRGTIAFANSAYRISATRYASDIEADAALRSLLSSLFGRQRELRPNRYTIERIGSVVFVIDGWPNEQ